MHCDERNKGDTEYADTLMKDEHTKKYIEKFINEITPERRKHLDDVFRKMRESLEDGQEFDQPMMRQTSFGGSIIFDENRKQVELEGEFSKEDLIRIALTLES